MSNAELAAASVKAAQAKLDEVKLSLGYTRVVAPIAGLSSRAPKSEGSLVTANDTLLTTISQANPIWVPFSISENEQLALNKAVSEGRLTLPKDNAFNVTVKLADGSVVPRRGRINFADTRINPATGTFEMRAEIAQRGWRAQAGPVRAGEPGRRSAQQRAGGSAGGRARRAAGQVRLRGGQGQGRQGHRRRTAGHRRHWVAQDGVNLWIIDGGLKAGDKVIVDGVSKLRPGAPIKLGGAPPRRAPCDAQTLRQRLPPTRSPDRREGPIPCSRDSSSTGRSSRPSSPYS